MKFFVVAAAFVASLPAVFATPQAVSAIAFPTTDCNSTNFVAKFESGNTCISTPGSQALSIVGTSGPGGCQVYTFSDSICSNTAFLNLVNLFEKCHTTETFQSVQIRCIAGG